MMKLSLMKRFFDTVNEDRQSPIADEMAARWLDRNATVRCVRASANFVFHVQTTEQQYFLRFNHSSERQVEFVMAELDYIHHPAFPQIAQSVHLCAACSISRGWAASRRASMDG